MKQPEDINRELLLRLLHYSETEHFDMVVDGAEEYLRTALRPEDKFAVAAMRKSPYFWKWWVGQWNRRNKMLIHEAKLDENTSVDYEHRETLRALFKDQHSPHYMNVYPNRLVMEQTYAIMIGEVIKEEVKGGRK